MGRKARAKMISMGLPRIRQRRYELDGAGVKTVDKVTGVKNGLPLLADGRTLDVPNVIWCTGYDLGLSWIDLPIFEANGEPRQTSGLVESEPGLYFVGQHFQHSVSSTMIHGAGRDASMVVRAIARTLAPASQPMHTVRQRSLADANVRATDVADGAAKRQLETSGLR
jgi:putative flavoprotein involved in K+ transport